MNTPVTAWAIPRWYSHEASRLVVAHDEFDLACRYLVERPDRLRQELPCRYLDERRQRLRDEFDRLVARGWTGDDLAGCLGVSTEVIDELRATDGAR